MKRDPVTIRARNTEKMSAEGFSRDVPPTAGSVADRLADIIGELDAGADMVSIRARLETLREALDAYSMAELYEAHQQK